jgi:hypothetical protein
VALVAPSPVFLGAVDGVTVTDGAVFNLDAPNFEPRLEEVVDVEDERSDEEVTIRGATGTGATTPGFGEGVRPMMGGPGLGDEVPEDAPEGLGVDGLLQEVKKSSSSTFAAVGAGSGLPTEIPSGNLECC